MVWYDHRLDGIEWHNLAGDKEYDQVKQRLKEFLPKVNEPWRLQTDLILTNT